MDRCGVCVFWRCKAGCKCKCHVPKQEALPTTEVINEAEADVCMVRHLDRRVLGSKETNLVPLSITDDRNFDYIDPRLKDQADLVACTDPMCPCGGACYHGHMDRQKVVVTVDEMEVRKQLWLGHGHSFLSLYGDDGEMQCALCQLHDYKRDDILALLSQAVANLREQHATEVTQAINQGREQGISQMRALYTRVSEREAGQ